jgi:hypothetical protein
MFASSGHPQLAILLVVLCIGCSPEGGKAPVVVETPSPATVSGIMAEAVPAAATKAASPDVLAAREAEAHARSIAPSFAPMDEIAEAIYEGPALMASYQGESVDGVYEGYGVLTLPDSGAVLAGKFSGGLPNGPGAERGMHGELVHEGIYVDGMPIEYLEPAPDTAVEAE